MSGAAAAMVGLVKRQLVVLPSTTYFNDPGTGGGGADSGLILYANGNANERIYTGAPLFRWILSGTYADYEAKLTLTSGTLDYGTAGTWLSWASGSSVVSWGCTLAFNQFGTKTVTATVEIRLKSTGEVLTSCNIEIIASNPQA